MALDGQVTYLSTDFPADFPRPRTPRRSPRLRMNDEDEEQMDDERTSQNVGMRAPIIGYEVIDQRQKFTVRLCALLFGKNSCRLSFSCVEEAVEKHACNCKTKTREIYLGNKNDFTRCLYDFKLCLCMRRVTP